MFTAYSADVTVRTAPEQLAPHPVPATMRWIDELADARRAVRAARRTEHTGHGLPAQRQVPSLLHRLEH